MDNSFNKRMAEKRQHELITELESYFYKIGYEYRTDLAFSPRFFFLLDHFEKTGEGEIKELCGTWKALCF